VQSLGTWSSLTSFPVPASQTLAPRPSMLLWLPVATHRPSGLNAQPPLFPPRTGSAGGLARCAFGPSLCAPKTIAAPFSIWRTPYVWKPVLLNF
jgi:hypothetical protein